MLEGFVIGGLVIFILAILYWPRRSPFVRRVTKSYNGQGYGKEREPY
jgi:hypothetical protein